MSGAGSQIDDELLASGLTRSRATEVVIAVASGAGLDVAATGPTQYRLSRTYRPGWVVPTAVVGALFFGLGLLLLLLVPKRNESCTVTLGESRRGVTVKLSGVLREDVAHQIRMGLGGHVSAPAAPHSRVGVSSPDSTSSIDDRLPAGSELPVSAAVPPMPSPWAPVSSPAASTLSPGVDATVVRGSLSPPSQGAATESAVPSIRLGHRALSLRQGIVVGRNPAPIEQLPGAQLVSVGDAALSKTHLAVRHSGSTIEVCDLSSTNGTAIETIHGRQACSPGTWIVIGVGATIVAGDQRLEVVE